MTDNVKNSNTEKTTIKNLEKKINYRFKNKSLIAEALTHSSFLNNSKRISSNERLEFLGDSILSVIVSEFLFKKIKHVPEGQLTKLRAGIVCEQSLFGFANEIGLGEMISMGKGEENTGGRQRKSILADAFEAVIAAVYLDGGMDAARVFVTSFIPEVETLKSGKFLNNDYKTILQEIIQKNPEERISYNIDEEIGEAHNKTFMASVLLNNQVIGKGKGSSKKEAEQAAAKEAISLMGIK